MIESEFYYSTSTLRVTCLFTVVFNSIDSKMHWLFFYLFVTILVLDILTTTSTSTPRSCGSVVSLRLASSWIGIESWTHCSTTSAWLWRRQLWLLWIRILWLLRIWILWRRNCWSRTGWSISVCKSLQQWSTWFHLDAKRCCFYFNRKNYLFFLIYLYQTGAQK